MNAQRHARVSAVFQAAIELPPAQRAGYLEETCGSDIELRREIESLVERDGRPAVLDQSMGVGPFRKLLDVDVSGPDAMPSRIGQYDICGVLGQGGVGIVFRAQQSNPKRPVALKVLNTTLPTPDMLRRFEFEAAVLGRLCSPGIAQIYDAGVMSDPAVPGRRIPYFAMELVEGRPLTEFAAGRNLDIRQRLRLMVKICEAVSHAHQKGVIHRDLKPANILVDEAGRPKVLDFGVARAMDDFDATLHTRAGQLVGTLAYMSPEQIAAEPAHIDTRNDVYALGVITFELLSGRLPWDLAGRSLTDCLDEIRKSEPPRLGLLNPALRGDIETIVAKALERDKDRRYVTVSALAADLEHYLRDEPISARPPSAIYQLRKFTRRNRVAVGSAAAVVVALIAGVITTTWQAARARDSEKRATQLAEDASAARQDAEDEARKATEITDFLQTMLTSASQEGGRGANFTVREALDEAAARIETEFADYPEIRLELQTTIGMGYKGLGLLAEAAPHLRASLETRRALLGRDHPALVRPMWTLALVLRYVGTAEETESLLREAHGIAVKHWGPGAPQARGITSSIALLRARMGDSDEALQLLEESLDGATHKSLAGRVAAKVRLGAALCLASDFAAAESAYREALALLDEGGSRSSIATRTHVLNHLAHVLHAQKKCDQAVPVLRELHERQVYAVGRHAPRVHASKVRLATCLHETGQVELAGKLAREAQAELLSEPENKQARCQQACGNLGRLFRRMGDTPGAEAMFRLGLKIAGTRSDDPEQLQCLADLAALLINSNRNDEAESILRTAITSAEKGPLKDHPQLLNCRRYWGNCLRRQGRCDEAELQLLAVHDAFFAQLGEDAPRTQHVIANLVELYEQCGRGERAAEFRERLRADVPPDQGREKPAKM